MSIQNTQTRRTAPLAGDGNGNPSPRAVPDTIPSETGERHDHDGQRGCRVGAPGVGSQPGGRLTKAACGYRRRGASSVLQPVEARRQHQRVAQSEECRTRNPEAAGSSPATLTIPHSPAVAQLPRGRGSRAAQLTSAVPDQSRLSADCSRPDVSSPSRRDTCGRSLRDRTGRPSIQTRARSLPAARQAGHSAGAADPKSAGPADYSEAV